MKNCKLRSEDFELFKKIVKITILIGALYKKVFELEINNKKNTKKYKETMNCLKTTIDVENQLYEEANLNFSKCIALIDYIFEYTLPYEFLSDIESIMTQDYSNRVPRRIINILFLKGISDTNSVKKMFPEELLGLMVHLKMQTPDKFISHAVNASVELQKAFEKDILNGFFAFLKDYIDKKDYALFKENLIRSKYNTSFINKAIEDDMLYSNFVIPKKFYVNSRLIADLTQTDLKLYEMLKNSYGVDESTKQISELIEMNDKDYNDIKNGSTSILRQCLMRSAFLLMDDETILDVNYEFHEFIETKEYLKRHPNDHISEEKIINCFKSIKSDRRKPNVLSLGYRRN